MYRPKAIQKVIHILVVAPETPELPPSKSEAPVIYSATSITSGQKCFAVKCHLLQAKGILRRLMTCAINWNVCSGCCNEAAKQYFLIRVDLSSLIEVSTENYATIVFASCFVSQLPQIRQAS